MSQAQWHDVVRTVSRNPATWVAQKQFMIRAIESPVGPIYPCVGVYTIDGRVAGIYGRFSHNPLIDFAAIDAAVLITDK